MDSYLFNGLVLFVATVVVGVIGYYARKQTAKFESTQEKHGEEISCLKTDVTTLQGKLWSETKLSNTVQNAVDKAFLQWENKMLKEGYFSHNNNTRRLPGRNKE